MPLAKDGKHFSNPAQLKRHDAMSASASDVAPPTDIVPPEDETAEPVLPPQQMMAEEQGEGQMTPDEAIEQIKSILAMLEMPKPVTGGMGNV